MRRSFLSTRQQNYIRKNYLNESVKSISRKFEMSATPVATFMRKEKLVVPDDVKLAFRINAITGKTTSTLAIDRFLKRNYLTMPLKTMARGIGKSDMFVRTRLRQLGLVIPPEVVAQNRTMTQFKPGRVPSNKGKKVSRETYKKMKRNMFKKGHIPATAMPRDGVITIRHDHYNRFNGKPYKWIRISLGKWELYHRYKWKKHRGPIPKSHIIWFKDGDTMNTKLSNLEMIHRGEGARRNIGTFRALPEPLQKTKKLINKLQNVIHEKQTV